MMYQYFTVRVSFVSKNILTGYSVRQPCFLCVLELICRPVQPRPSVPGCSKYLQGFPKLQEKYILVTNESPLFLFYNFVSDIQTECGEHYLEPVTGGSVLIYCITKYNLPLGPKCLMEISTALTMDISIQFMYTL